MRIFITGATGFAGSHLVDNLLAEGHQLFALVRSVRPSLPQHPNFQPLVGDLLDVAALKTAVFAAQTTRNAETLFARMKGRVRLKDEG
ncbi:MAG: NAD(P)H-binding protein [Anaerolineales bacterium]|nr:NAD(P)H-binding protein [Anaerolineales bacterium]